MSANHPYLQPEGWIVKGTVQQDWPKTCERHLWLPPNGCEWSWSTVAKPGVFDLHKGQTTTPGTPVPHSLWIVCGFFNVPQLFATRVMRWDLLLIVLIHIALTLCKHACKVDCDVKSGIDPPPFWLGREQKMLGFAQVLKPMKWQDFVGRRKIWSQCVSNRCKDSF